MRTFIAIEIPPDIRSRISQLIEDLRPAAPNVRWARTEGLHVTLKFLGEVPLPKVDTVKQALASIRGIDPFVIQIGGAGYFPTERAPRVVWLGVQAGHELTALAARVDAALGPVGFAKEDRPYKPHLTLARVQMPAKIAALQQQLRKSEPLDVGSFTATEFYLYESKTAPKGSIYSKLERFAMAPVSSEGSPRQL
jgi:RNA 2',3'-cyclic 3'-phosphodiesterase